MCIRDRAYIDAVASELLPAIERADRALGGLFAGLNAAFFQGVVVPALGEKDVYKRQALDRSLPP